MNVMLPTPKKTTRAMSPQKIVIMMQMLKKIHEETLRLIQLPTSNRTENHNLEQDDNNINNVLNGLEVKFPID